MSVLQGLIFDLDGTLMDSAPDLRQAVNRTLATHGRRELSLAEVTRMIGDGMLTLLTRAFAETGDPIDESQSYVRFQEFITYYRTQKPDPNQIYKGARETLDFYQKAGVKLGLCTNKQEAATIGLLEALDLRKYFAFVAGGDTFTVHKPHPGHVSGVVEALGLTPAVCVMIGDGPQDLAAATGAGVPCVLVTHGYGGDELKEHATVVISGFDGLQNALVELGFKPI